MYLAILEHGRQVHFHSIQCHPLTLVNTDCPPKLQRHLAAAGKRLFTSAQCPRFPPNEELQTVGKPHHGQSRLASDLHHYPTCSIHQPLFLVQRLCQDDLGAALQMKHLFGTAHAVNHVGRHTSAAAVFGSVRYGLAVEQI